MRVALLAYNAPPHNAVGNRLAEQVRFFQERGAEVCLFVQDARRLHPDLKTCAVILPAPATDGPAWKFLHQADLILAAYSQYYDLLQYLPLLAGAGPRIVFDYLGVTPPHFWDAADRQRLEASVRQRGYVWCADHALTTSQANCAELREATRFPSTNITTQPLSVNVERFRPRACDRFLQQKLGIDGRILLFVGRLAGNKRVPLLIEALARLGDPRAHVMIVGDCSDVYADEAARCLTLAQQFGVANRVHLVGELDETELPRAYRSADVLVMPSVHEGFCVPVIEAFASGCPVIASRSAALPETVGDAGLTFAPNDADDLVRQLRRVLDEKALPPSARPRRVAVVSFRFGSDIVGGAETSLRSMAQALHAAGQHVEVFTTCTKSESHWTNELPAGTSNCAGLTVHRVPVDPHDADVHGELVRAIRDADGQVSAEVAGQYLTHSIHSTALIATLRERRQEFDAIITGPYLFGLTADIAREFPGQTLLVPCFHDEPLARLPVWPRLYGDVAGILYHSAEEQAYAQAHFGVNHPNATLVGVCLLMKDEGRAALPADLRRPYVVYCGRYSEQKNVPLLLEWARQYREQNPDGFDFVFVGRGEFGLPQEEWLHDLGFVDEPMKRAVLAEAKALVQLSRQESLSLVALEAWTEGTPVIAHADCTVLVGQIKRSQGGVAVADFDEFAGALDELLSDDSLRKQRGDNGRAFVADYYASASTYVDRLLESIDRTRQPISEQMRTRGMQRAQQYSRECWQQRFAEFIERVLLQPARRRRDGIEIEPLRPSFRTSGERTLLMPVRLVNTGTHAAVAEGLGRTVLCWEICPCDDKHAVAHGKTSLPSLLAPGQTQMAAIPVSIPDRDGAYVIRLWARCADREIPMPVETPLHVERAAGSSPGGGASAFLENVTKLLPRAHALQRLPMDYVDVTEGTLAPVKRFIKRKLLHNFRRGYIDLLSRQHSEVNEQLVLMVQQLAECCAMLDHAVAGMQNRIDDLEARIDAAPDECAEPVRRSHG